MRGLTIRFRRGARSVRGAWAVFVALGLLCGGSLSAEQATATRPPVVTPPPGPPLAPGTRPALTPTPAADGRYDLTRDERRGGHTLQRHIGKTDDELRQRLVREREVSAASTYTDLPTAERVVFQTLARNRDRVRAWLERSGDRPNLALEYRSPGGAVIGRSLPRGARTAVPCADARVVLRWDRARSFYVLTTYPEVRR